MHTYTTERENKIFEIYPESDGDDEDYIEELLAAAKGFRSFGRALATFLADRGYISDVQNHVEVITCLTSKFREAGIKVPRNMKKWFEEPIEGIPQKSGKIERKTAYQICFALGLDAEETEDFFRRIYLERGFDRHNAEEVIYYYTLAHGLSYGEACRMIEQLSESEDEGNTENDKQTDERIPYTGAIIEEIEKLTDAGELVTFLKEHRAVFAYRNVTAYGYIQRLWKEIADEEGLAAREKKTLYRQFAADMVADKTAYGKESDDTKQICSERSKEERRRTCKKQSGADSLWDIYLQILGLAGTNITRLGTDRSLKPVLRDNDLLHPLAEDCFPDRDGLNKVLNGEKVSYERVRKLIILLAFYRFWVRRALKSSDYQAQYGDRERCVSNINNFLIDAGYPALYAGNPYDWIILFAAADNYPLRVFREYMRELFFRMQEQNAEI